jgi:hypothetical protein
MARNAVFKKEWLNRFKIIDREFQKVRLQVATPVTEKNRIRATEPGKSDKYIVTLCAVPRDKFEVLKNAFAGGRTEVPYEELKGVFLTGQVWVNDPSNPPMLPLKNEEVFCNIGYVKNRQQEPVLRVTAMAQSPEVTLPPVPDWDAFFDSLPPVDAEGNVLSTTEVGADEIRH